MALYRTFTTGVRVCCRPLSISQQHIRHASLNSAIERGFRQASRSKKSYYDHTSSDDRVHDTRGRAQPGGNADDWAERRSKKKHQYSDEEPERVKAHVQPPKAMPHTHPASEFVYGINAVDAALRCGRRKLYRLYIYQAFGELLDAHKIAVRKAALARNVPVKMAFGPWLRLFDQACSGRPHNGCVLEASHLPLLPVKSLYPLFDPKMDCFGVELAPQSREEAAVNGSSNEVPIIRGDRGKTFPVVLLLDGVLDPGNLGAIIRSAYYLGVDAIVFAGRNSAPLSPVAIKSSAGAAENMTFLHVTNEMDFIKRSQDNGWRFYAAEAPGLGAIVDDGQTQVVNQHPSVLMMGNEGTGLSNRIRRLADSTVSIPNTRNPVMGFSSDPARVDSLNVSVAAALLMEKFLHVPMEISQA